jgi:hypothetical protein
MLKGQQGLIECPVGSIPESISHNECALGLGLDGQEVVLKKIRPEDLQFYLATDGIMVLGKVELDRTDKFMIPNIKSELQPHIYIGRPKADSKVYATADKSEAARFEFDGYRLFVQYDGSRRYLDYVKGELSWGEATAEHTEWDRCIGVRYRNVNLRYYMSVLVAFVFYMFLSVVLYHSLLFISPYIVQLSKKLHP